MKFRRRWTALAVAALVGTTVAVIESAQGAGAAGGSVSPVITGDPNAVGTIAFYNKAGTQVYTGTLASKHIADYAVASTAPTRSTTRALMTFAVPDHTAADSQTYFTAGQTAASTWKPAVVPPATLGGPVPVSVAAAAAANHPVVSLAPTDGDIGGAFGAGINDPTAGFDHVVQVRMLDSGPGNPVQVVPFWQADVYIDTAAGTWTQLFPVPPAAAASTSITSPLATPASPAPAGTTSVALSATVSASDNTHPAGTVHLFNGATDVGAATLNAATGAISASAPVVNGGTYSFVFKFTPSGNYTASTSAAVAYSVGTAATSTSITSPLATPASPAPAGTTSVALSATVSASDNTHPAGTVHLFNGATDVGAATLNAATGAISASAPVVNGGTYSFVLKFTPSGNYTASTSAAVAYSVGTAATSTSITSPLATPASPAPAGTTSVALSATVSASDNTHPAGTVHLFNGATDVGAATLNAATGAISASAPVVNGGTYSFLFKFLPSGSYSGSSSNPLAYTVLTPPSAIDTSISAITANPVSPAPAGTTSVALSANLTAQDNSHPAGTVHLYNGATDVGAATLTAATGAVSASAPVADGTTYSFTFKYTPSGNFNPSASGALDYVVSAPIGAVDTTISAPTAIPVSPAPAGTTSVTLSGTVSANDHSHPAGAVHTFNGATDLGLATFDAATGAVTATVPVADSTSYSFSFSFTPSGNYNPSASAALAYTVNGAAASTTTTVSGPTAATVGTAVTLHADVKTGSPAAEVPGVAGSVQFLVAGSNAGAPVALTSTGADFFYTAASPGSVVVTATFIPASGQDFAASIDATGVSVTATAPTPSTSISTITATPASPAPSGTTSVALSATLTAGDTTHPAGTVELFDGTTDVGPASLDAASGAITATATVSDGTSYSFSLEFTPNGNYVGTTSAVLPYTVSTASATPTTLALTVNPAGPVDSGTPVVVTASVSPSAAAGAVTFFDGGSQLGNPVPVTAGRASNTLSALSVGQHSFTASFAPADPAAFGTSQTANAVLLMANKAATICPTAHTAAKVGDAVPEWKSSICTTTTLVASPSGTAPAGTAVALSAAVTPSAATGKVEFFDGTASLGTSAVAVGAATVSVSTLAVGDHSLTAVFTPTSGGVYTGSASASVALSITATTAKIDGVTSGGQPVLPGATLVQGQTVTVTASGFLPGETVTAVVHSDPVSLGSAVADGSGAVSATFALPATLAAGAHSLTLSGAVSSASFAFVIAAPASPSANATTTAPTSAMPAVSPSTSPTPGSGSSVHPHAVTSSPSVTPTRIAQRAASSGGSLLASTGAQILPAGLIGLMLIVGGLFFLTSGRRRSH